MGTIVACYGEGEQSTGLRLDPAARRQGGGSRDGGQPAGAGTTREGTRGRPRHDHMGDGMGMNLYIAERIANLGTNRAPRQHAKVVSGGLLKLFGARSSVG